jgi:recombinational DNA repair protein (RecF pathway)
MLLDSEAYVLLRHPLTESSWIVSLFTREAGHVRAVAKAARRVKSPFRGALEPMSLVQVRVRQREGHELGQLSSAALLESALDLHGRWPEAGVLMGISETLERGLPEHSAEEETYRLVAAVLAGLRAGVTPLCAWAYFVAWFLRLHGVMPRPEGRALDRGAEATLAAFYRQPLREFAGQSFPEGSLERLRNVVYLALSSYLGRTLACEDALEGLKDRE